MLSLPKGWQSARLMSCVPACVVRLAGRAASPSSSSAAGVKLFVLHAHVLVQGPAREFVQKLRLVRPPFHKNGQLCGHEIRHQWLSRCCRSAVGLPAPLGPRSSRSERRLKLRIRRDGQFFFLFFFCFVFFYAAVARGLAALPLRPLNSFTQHNTHGPLQK